MRFWFTPSTEVPLREQIVQQVRLGILDGQLRPGARLPSTRHFARRYGMHANTVSAAFQQLREEGWTTARHGSGTFVAASAGIAAKPDAQPLSPGQRLDFLLLQVAQLANSTHVPADQLHRMLDDLLQRPRTPARRVLVEPDAALARIVQHEIATCTGLHLPHLRMDTAEFAARLARALQGATAVVLPTKANAARAALPAHQVIPLQIQTVSAALASQLPCSRSYLVAVASCWPPFLQIARTMLIGAGFAADSILLRDTNRLHWQNGLEVVEAVVCDSITAQALAAQHNIFPFPIVAPSSLAYLQKPAPM